MLSDELLIEVARTKFFSCSLILQSCEIIQRDIYPSIVYRENITMFTESIIVYSSVYGWPHIATHVHEELVPVFATAELPR